MRIAALGVALAVSAATTSAIARPAGATAPGRCGPLSAARAGEALETLLAAVRGALPAGAEVRATDATLRGCERLPERFATVEVVPAVGARVSDRARATLRLLDASGKRVGRAWLQADLAIRVPAVVAARTLPANATIRQADLGVALIPYDRLPTRAVETVASAIGLRTRSPVPEGAALRESILERPLLVRRGDLVQAMVRRGDLLISGRGVAQEDGRLGETIRLESPDGDRAFLGRVAAADRVEVQ